MLDINATLSDDAKFSGGVLAPNGILYFVPFSVPYIGKFDPVVDEQNSFSLIDISAFSEISASARPIFMGGVLAPNGIIYFVPGVYVYTYVYTYICMCVCACVCIMYACMHVFIRRIHVCM